MDFTDLVDFPVPCTLLAVPSKFSLSSFVLLRVLGVLNVLLGVFVEFDGESRLLFCLEP